MSLSRIKTWARNEILLSSDLNAEFNNVLQNGVDVVFPLSNDLDVGSKLLINTGLDSPSQLHGSIQTMDKYSFSLSAAIAGIGSTKMTLLIGDAITVGSDITIPDNVFLWFVGAGKFFVNATYTITINSPSQVLAHTQQQVFDGTGTVLFTNGGIISPGWFGFSSGGTDTTNYAAYTMAVASVPATYGSVFIIPPTGVSHKTSNTLAHGNKYISVIGAHPDLSIIEMTATSSLKHGLTFQRSHHLKNLTIKTTADLASNYDMYGVRMNLDGVTISGGNQAVKWESLKVRGFNNSLYIDGGDAYNVDRVYFNDLDLKCTGPASTYIGSCLYVNRINQIYGTHCQLDQNDTGEHAIYCFGSKNIVLDGFKIRNATKGEAQAIKLVGNGVAPDDDQAYPTWCVRNMDIADCLNGILCGIYGTETLDALTVENCKFLDVDSTSGILGIVYLSAAGTSTIRSLKVSNITHRNSLYQGVHCATAAGATIGQLTIRDCNAYNWSTSSAGSYTWFGTSGSGTFGPIHLENIEANGNSNGKTIVGLTGQASAVSRLTFSNLRETGTTAPGRPLTDTDTSATFNFAIGNSWSVSGTRTVTAASNAVAGEVYVIRGSNANCTFTDNAVFSLNGNWVSASDKTLTLLCLTSSTFVELARSTN